MRWRVSDAYEMQDTYALTQMTSLEGKVFNPFVFLCPKKYYFWKPDTIKRNDEMCTVVLQIILEIALAM